LETVKLISVAILKKWLDTGKKVSILDIRPASQRTESSITGSIHIDVYDKLKQNDSSAFDNLHLDKSVPIVTFCGGGKASMIAAAMLSLKGYDAFSLEGGLNEWNKFHTTEAKSVVL
jgi:rhodanese-related sulfurtransferase